MSSKSFICNSGKWLRSVHPRGDYPATRRRVVYPNCCRNPRRVPDCCLRLFFGLSLLLLLLLLLRLTPLLRLFLSFFLLFLLCLGLLILLLQRACLLG